MPVYLLDKKKAYTIRWIKWPISGIVMCSCGYGTPFTKLLTMPGQYVKCQNPQGCEHSWEIEYKRFNTFGKQW